MIYMNKSKHKWLKYGGIALFLLFLTGLLVIFFTLRAQVGEVNKWRDTVEAVSKKHGIAEQSHISLAIILTETKGSHIDLMQSSESKYGQQDQINNAEESIDLGVSHLAEMIKLSEEKKVDIWTAVQAYNFGANYIDYVKKHGGKTSVKLAEKYSRDILAPTLGNTTSKKYKYLNPHSLLYNGGYLYKNGGNFFYAEMVKWNGKVLDFFS